MGGKGYEDSSVEPKYLLRARESNLQFRDMLWSSKRMPSDLSTSWLFLTGQISDPSFAGFSRLRSPQKPNRASSPVPASLLPTVTTRL
jgi:hypothetical protein